MQYDKIILELMGRIQNLEEEVEALREWRSKVEGKLAEQSERKEEKPCEEQQEVVAPKPEVRSGRLTKLTPLMVKMCYEGGKELAGGAELKGLVSRVVSESGMNRNTAIMYLYVVKDMLNGEEYKRAVGSEALRAFLDMFYDDFGKEGLAQALRATWLNIKYREGKNIYAGNVEKIYNEYVEKYGINM